MKYVKGASKHEQAVPCQRKAGAAPWGACREVLAPSQPAELNPEPNQPPAAGSPQPGSCWWKGAWSSLAREGEGAL